MCKGSGEEKPYTGTQSTKLNQRLHKNDNVNDISSDECTEANEDEKQLIVVVAAALEAVTTSSSNVDIVIEKEL